MIYPPESQDITTRFFQALDALKELKHIRGLKTFSSRYGINTANFWVARRDNERVRPEWLTYIVRDYGVSANWLLTGKGKMFTKEMIPNAVYKRSQNKINQHDPDKT